MNKYNIKVLNLFASEKNISDLKKFIEKKYAYDPSLIKKIKNNFSCYVHNFIKRIQKEWLYSDKLRYISPDILDRLMCLNSQFVDYIHQTHIKNVGCWEWSDGYPASSLTITRCNVKDYLNGCDKKNHLPSTYGQPIRKFNDEDLRTIIDYNSKESPMLARSTHNLTARNGLWRRGMLRGNERTRITYTNYDVSTNIDRKLESFRYQSRPIQINDNSKLVQVNKEYTPDRFLLNTNELNKAKLTSGEEISYEGDHDDYVENGTYGSKFRNEDIEFEGNNYHVERLMSNALNQSLNQGSKLWVDGYGTHDQDDPEDMKRLMQHNVFRSYRNNQFMTKDGSKYYCIPNGDLAENQIPFFEKSLYMRDYDRTITDETIGGSEFGAIQRGYDMNSLYCRLKNENLCDTHAKKQKNVEKKFFSFKLD